MKTYDLKLITFLSQENTIMIRSTHELKMLQKVLSSIGLQIPKHFEDTIKKEGPIFLEYCNWKGFSYYNDRQQSVDWYESEPFEVADIIKETSE